MLRDRRTIVDGRSVGIIASIVATAIWTIGLAATAPNAAPLEMAPQTNQPAIEITAFAINMSNIGTGASSTVQIQVNRWTPDPERDALMALFLEKGADALLSGLQKAGSVGTIRLPTTIGYDLRFARSNTLEEGARQIVLATDRPIGAFEAMNQPRSIDYPFTLIEIRVDKNGKGEGKLSVATKITYDKRSRTVRLEDYASEPVRLENVQVQDKR